ncbi:MAG: beta-propeller fold lactonase family protein [Dehalococcoidia bacterium]|nr:beta-propeller fold lactonase family protein [Dehalococcoidia bacterium]
MKKLLALAIVTIMLVPTLSACRGHSAAGTGWVYVMNNSTTANAVLAYTHDANGNLVYDDSYATQGRGSGSFSNSLGSQGALSLSKDGKWLGAVNAGSNEISIFKTTNDGLVFADKTSSLGQFPCSIAITGRAVFVLNQKSTPPNITAFTMDKDGVLDVNKESTRQLPPGTYSSIEVSPNGRWLVATGESNSILLTYAVDGNNLGIDPIVTESSGRGPSGLAFSANSNLLVVEAATSAISEYSISNNGLQTITASLSTGQQTPRWIAVSGNFVYAANLTSRTISCFEISRSDNDKLLAVGVVADVPGVSEIAASSDGKYLYVLDNQSMAIQIFKIEKDGKLTPEGSVGALIGRGAQGIAAG